MDRKEFLKSGLAVSLVAGLGFDSVGQTHANEVPKVGFNHLPLPKTQIMSNSVLHKAESRGHANHGWLNSYHTFSFASYYNPERIHFGALRVLNDDTIDPGTGFGTHPHDNMEIISIALEGELEHQDSMGNRQIIRPGEVQVMSAGRGIRHSEKNPLRDQKTKFLQIWVFPDKKNVEPRYDQQVFPLQSRKNNLVQVLSPNPDDKGVWIHQKAWFHLGAFDRGFETQYSLKLKGNGLYVFVIEGDLEVDSQILNRRDGYGVWDTENIKLKALSSTELLLMEVPMNF
jgi:redox-sensitive bicupin YhaK (pirin superfamily)